MTPASKNFPKLLKSWRAGSKVSQLELALRCSVSQRHISFLELGRAAPSRSMVHSICNALDIPLRERNRLLQAAGFAPIYKESDLNSPELADVRQTLMMMLDHHEPYPALVVDRLLNIVLANNGTRKLQLWLYGCDRPEDLPAIAGNFFRGMFSPEGYRQHVKNWEECAGHILRGIDIDELGDISQHVKNELRSRDGMMESLERRMMDDWLAPLMTLDLEKDGQNLRLFLTSTTLSAPMNVTLQEMHVRSCFPADDATRQFFANHADETG